MKKLKPPTKRKPKAKAKPKANKPVPDLPVAPAVIVKKENQAAQVLKLIVAGYSESDILEAIARLYPAADPPSLIMSSMEYLEAASQFNPRVLVGWCLEATRDLYRRLIENRDYVGALRAVKQLAELASYVSYSPEEDEEVNDQTTQDDDGQAAQHEGPSPPRADRQAAEEAI